MKKVIITGANGFIGSAVTKELLRNGIEVIALDMEGCNNNLPDDERIVFIACELANIKAVEKTLEGCEADVFYHFAWAGSFGSARANVETQLQNVQWTVDMVRLAKKIGCHKFIGIGTLAQFDCNAHALQNGSVPPMVSCYATAKIAAQYMSKAVANEIGIDHTWTYLANTYGEGNYTLNFVNFATKIMLSGEEAKFTSGEQYYDLIHISDVAKALCAVGRYGKQNYAYYIGSTKPRKLKEYIYLIRDAINPNIQLHLDAIPYNGVSHPIAVFDCTQLLEDTGYCPSINFEQGIIDTVKWVKKEIENKRI